MKNTREEEILSILKKQQFASVKYLSDVLFISPSSIRRDLSQMERAGLVERSYGGVILREELHSAPPFPVRSERNRHAKKEIAALAASLLSDDLTIILDDSSTVFGLAEHLTRFRNITVITNNLVTAEKTVSFSIPTYMIGGVSRTGTTVMTGGYALEMLDRMHADLCFFSCFALSDDGEISDCTEDSNTVRKKMLERADRKIFLCDSSKYHLRATHKLCDVADVDCAVTDAPLPESVTAGLGEKVRFLVSGV